MTRTKKPSLHKGCIVLAGHDMVIDSRRTTDFKLKAPSMQKKISKKIVFFRKHTFYVRTNWRKEPKKEEIYSCPRKTIQRNTTAHQEHKSQIVEDILTRIKKETFKKHFDYNCRNFRKTQNKKSNFTFSTSV